MGNANATYVTRQVRLWLGLQLVFHGSHTHRKNKKSKLAVCVCVCVQSLTHFESAILIGYYIIYRLPSFNGCARCHSEQPARTVCGERTSVRATLFSSTYKRFSFRPHRYNGNQHTYTHTADSTNQRAQCWIQFNFASKRNLRRNRIDKESAHKGHATTANLLKAKTGGTSTGKSTPRNGIQSRSEKRIRNSNTTSPANTFHVAGTCNGVFNNCSWNRCE